jgi:hypothetical protein
MGVKMNLSRRSILKAAAVLPLAASTLEWRAFAQSAPAASPAAEIPPMLFVHGNGDQAPVWLTTFWRMESNGIPRERMFAINFTDPQARTDDTVAQPQHSSTEDQRRELSEAVADLKRRTGAARVALIGNSRGGNSIRSFIKRGGAADVSHAVLCGTPNHGVFVTDDNLGNEFNGRGPFLRGLNEGESEVVPGVAFLTLRSDGQSADAGVGAVVIMARPRGYFGLPRDVVLFDGREPADVKSGVPTDWSATLRLSAAEVGRPVAGLFNEERIVARAWPAAENRIAVAELTY